MAKHLKKLDEVFAALVPIETIKAGQVIIGISGEIYHVKEIMPDFIQFGEKGFNLSFHNAESFQVKRDCRVRLHGQVII